tara:strand:- start:2070 stop:3890 length:1821 start_codon:yes stop_codon:yes gene_type:complete
MKGEIDENIDLVDQHMKESIDYSSHLKQGVSYNKSLTTLSPYEGEFGRLEKRHLLNRCIVGHSNHHLIDLEGLSLDQSIDLIFQTEELSEPVNTYYYQISKEEYFNKYGSVDVDPGEPFISNAVNTENEGGPPEERGQERREAFDAWFIQSICDQETSIHWKLFIFLHQLVPTDVVMTGGIKGGYVYIKTLFEGAFGSYKQLIYDITIDPTMLSYLNLQSSIKETPDENYGREIQELFTVGKRPFSSFTEKDVREISRALVGWKCDVERFHGSYGLNSNVEFNPDNHDTGDKYFSSFYNDKIITGKSGVEGSDELREVVDMIFDTEESCKYICSRLYQFFVNPKYDNEIERNIIEPMAQIMRENDFSLIEPLKALLKSSHFFDTSNHFSLIKNPVDFMFNFIKEFNIFDGVLHHGTEDYQTIYYSQNNTDFVYPDEVVNILSRSDRFYNWFSRYDVGMRMLYPPNVAGWPPFYQSPSYDLFWINSLTLQTRHEIISILKWGVYLGVEDIQVNLKFNLYEYFSTIEQPSNLNHLIQEMMLRITGYNAPEKLLTRLRGIAIGSFDEYYWTNGVNQFMNNPILSNELVVRDRFEDVLLEIYKLPETQLT